MARGQGTQGSVSEGEAPEELKGPKGAKCKGSFRVCSHDNSTWGYKDKNRAHFVADNLWVCPRGNFTGGRESLGIALQTVTGSVCALTLCFHLIQAGKVTSRVLPWPLGPSPTIVLGAVQKEKLFFPSGSEKKQAKILLCTETIRRGVTPDPAQTPAPFISGLNPAHSHLLQHALRTFSCREASLQDFAVSPG